MDTYHVPPPWAQFTHLYRGQAGVSAARSQAQILARDQVSDTSDRCQLVGIMEGWGCHQGLPPLSTSDSQELKSWPTVLASLTLFYVKSLDFLIVLSKPENTTHVLGKNPTCLWVVWPAGLYFAMIIHQRQTWRVLQ